MTSAPSIIGIAGFARSGKDTAADILVKQAGYTKRAFADSLRSVLYAMNPIVAPSLGGNVDEHFRVQDIVDELGWEDAKTAFPEMRELMKGLGNGVRDNVNSHIWIAKALADRPRQLVISDVRFVNEAEAIRALGGIIVKIRRPGVEAESDFEREVDRIRFDYCVINNGTLDRLDAELHSVWNHALRTAERPSVGRPSVNDEFNALARRASAARAAAEREAQVQGVYESIDSTDLQFQLNRAFMRQKPIWPSVRHGITDPVFKADL